MSDVDEGDDPEPEPEWSPFAEAQMADQKGWIGFVNLEGKKESFYTPNAGKPWAGVRVPDCDAVVPWDGEDELLYPIPDDRHVLVYWDDAGLGGPPKPWDNRELRSQESSLWFMLNRKHPPPPLIPVPITDPGQDPASRLNRDWQPAGPAPPSRQDQQALPPPPPAGSAVVSPPPVEPIREDAPAVGPGPKHQPPGDHEHVESSGDRTPPPPPPIDYRALVAALRKQKKGNPALLVEYMAERDEATAEEIGKHVHGDASAEDDAIRRNIERTNDALASLGSRLWFKFALGYVYREISPR
jgi:hypothetical protein